MAVGVSIRGMLLYFLAVLLAAPASAQGLAPYLDDRSDPASLVRSYYNAIARQEYARAYGYLAEPRDYASFAAGYSDTDKVEIALGSVISEGAAGSIYARVPVAVRSVSTSGEVQVFAGCYTTRQIQPAIQEPPFRPIQISEGRLTKALGDLAAAVPADCSGVDGQ
jgi:hypothetical protein